MDDRLDPEVFDVSLEPHVLTDRDLTKTLPCRTCRRPCVVTRFMAPAKVECRDCRGEEGGVATIVAAVPGMTDPAKAQQLVSCLINPHFAHAICPFDPEHSVELKSVSHNAFRGPSQYMGSKNGIPVYDQVDPGETVMHQCNDCKTVITLSTAHVQLYRRQNEPRSSTNDPSPWSWMNGTRDEAA